MKFINGCEQSAIEALRYLAQNPRPEYGQEKFNSEHLYDIAKELEQSIKDGCNMPSIEENFKIVVQYGKIKREVNYAIEKEFYARFDSSKTLLIRWSTDSGHETEMWIDVYNSKSEDEEEIKRFFYHDMPKLVPKEFDADFYFMVTTHPEKILNYLKRYGIGIIVLPVGLCNPQYQKVICL